MKKSDEKRFLCERHKGLLQIIVRYGRGAMLLAQLRTFCLAVRLYPSGQAVNRAVRDLRAVDILGRQTWVDGKSDLILARKAVYSFLRNVIKLTSRHSEPVLTLAWESVFSEQKRTDCHVAALLAMTWLA